MGHCIPVIASFQENGGCTNFTRFLKFRWKKKFDSFKRIYTINKIPIEKDDLFETRTASLFLIDYILNSSWSWLQKLNIIKIVLNEIIRYSSVLYNLKLCYSWHEFRKKKDFENLKFSQLKNLSSRLTKLGHESIFKSSFIAPKQQTIDIIIQLAARTTNLILLQRSWYQLAHQVIVTRKSGSWAALWVE